jgi:cell division septation protein DedD
VGVLLLGVVVLAVVAGLAYARARTRNVSADTVFVSAPAWPAPSYRKAAPQAPQPAKEWLLQVGAYVDKQDAEALAARLRGLAWPVSIVVPVSATDSLNKVIVSGIGDKATARRVADSLGSALKVRVAILEPMGARIEQ